jgi:hypothetical protein
MSPFIHNKKNNRKRRRRKRRGRRRTKSSSIKIEKKVFSCNMSIAISSQVT